MTRRYVLGGLICLVCAGKIEERIRSLDAQRTGPGLAASKKRNSANAANCPSPPQCAGSSHSTSQKEKVRLTSKSQ